MQFEKTFTVNKIVSRNKERTRIPHFTREVKGKEGQESRLRAMRGRTNHREPYTKPFLVETLTRQ